MEGRTWSARLSISYRTLAVFRPDLEPYPPFNDWTPTHVDQGFSWRPGSVSFQAIDPMDMLGPEETADADEALGRDDDDWEGPTVLVQLRPTHTPEPDAVRIITVPFDVYDGGVVVTSPFADDWDLDMPAGQYALFFSIEPDIGGDPREPWRYRLTFVPVAEPTAPEILRADWELRPPKQLLMHAVPV
jgi:hypothetical protein